MYRPKNVHPRRQSIFITSQTSSTSSSSSFGASGDSRTKLRSSPVHSPQSRANPKNTLAFMAASGLLPGIPRAKAPRPGLSISYESEICRKDIGGTSPVTSASVAAAMTANIPMAIAFTMRQISEEKKTQKMINRSISQESKKSQQSTKISAESNVSDVTMSQSLSSDSFAYSLPKPTWSDTQRSENDVAIVRSLSNASSTGKNVRRQKRNTCQWNPHLGRQVPVTNRTNLTTSDISDVDLSGPSSPASSSHTSIVSSLSDASSIGIISNSRQADLELGRVPSVDNSAEHSVENDELISNMVCGKYDTNFDKVSLHYTPITKTINQSLAVVEVHRPPDRQTFEKSRNTSPLPENLSANYYSSGASSNLSVCQKSNGTVDEKEVTLQLNDIINDNSARRTTETTRAPYLNGKLSKNWLHSKTSDIFDGLCSYETQV